MVLMFGYFFQQVEGSWPDHKCKKVVLAEDADGIYVHPSSKWTHRTEANADAKFDFVATKFGQRAPNKEIEFEECLGVFSPGPQPVGKPLLDVPTTITTDDKGVTTVTVKTLDPKNPRGYIDGQLYSYCYSVKDSRRPDTSSFDNVIVVRLYDAYENVESPTWLDNIFPIFKEYADLYPVMTENFVDLGNYYDVKEKKISIEKTLDLHFSHPNYMPVTRDLSNAKRTVILKWLRTDDLPIGQWKDEYSLEQLKKDLQTALQIEHATIPTYLTALGTIKDAVYNLEVQSVFKVILVQEMLHMALVANILNAVGGDPKLYFDGFIPEYPSHLPGGVQPDLAVPIEKCSLPLIRNVFMKIEQPMDLKSDGSVADIHKCPSKDRKCAQSPADADLKTASVAGVISSVGVIEPCPSSRHSCQVFRTSHGLGTSKMGPQGTYQMAGNFKSILPSFTHPSNSIGAFYKHIRKSLERLVAAGENVFTGTNKTCLFVEQNVLILIG